MMVVVLMGVAGCGKSTVGPLLAARLGGDFAEGDTFHPASNVEKMRGGRALDDDDRLPWLEAMAAAIRAWRTKDRPTVLGCSALKAAYRDILSGGSQEVRFVHLHGTKAQVAERLAARRGHFMPASLLDSQFAALEAPDDALVLDIAASPEKLADEAARRLGA
jgi:carbohydrate kinase (thermoresistant glucokinase family)